MVLPNLLHIFLSLVELLLTKVTVMQVVYLKKKKIPVFSINTSLGAMGRFTSLGP